MKRLLLTLILLGARVAYTYEYKLQFTPQGGAYGLTVAGYAFYGGTVAGNCSYYTVTSGSGRGSHGTTTHHYNTCSWDLFGNLISLTPVSSAPVPPPPISTTGDRDRLRSQRH
jgi:prolipoprotein diacylglyceryltransferase